MRQQFILNETGKCVTLEHYYILYFYQCVCNNCSFSKVYTKWSSRELK